MSAPVAAHVLQELGATPRRFKSVKSAVRWFRAYGAKQTRTTKDVSAVGTPVSRGELDVARATYAALLCCFRALDPGVDDEDLRTLLGPTLEWICGEYSRIYLAERNGLTEHGFSRWVARGERTLRRRLEARQLLEARE